MKANGFTPAEILILRNQDMMRDDYVSLRNAVTDYGKQNDSQHKEMRDTISHLCAQRSESKLSLNQLFAVILIFAKPITWIIGKLKLKI